MLKEDGVCYNFFILFLWSRTVSPREGLYSHHGRLIRFLKGIALRFQLLTALEFLLLLASYVFLMLIGSLFVQELREVVPYLPFVFTITSLSLFFLLMLLGFYRIFSRPSMGQLAREVEQKFPQLKDDVTNALLLSQEMERPLNSGQISRELVTAHLDKTTEKVSTISPSQVVSFRQASRHLRLLIPLLIAFSILLAVDPQWLNRSLATILHPFSSLPTERNVPLGRASEHDRSPRNPSSHQGEGGRIHTGSSHAHGLAGGRRHHPNQSGIARGWHFLTSDRLCPEFFTLSGHFGPGEFPRFEHPRGRGAGDTED